MIRPIDIRLNAAHPDLPLAEAVTYTGAPSTVLIRGVPGNCGRWAITAVFVAVTFPDGSTSTRTAVQSANGVWVATLPSTATSGRTAHGLRILADGADENGEAVGGYVLGVADFAVASLGISPAPQPGETSWQMLYFDAVPGVLRKGDVTKVDGVLKLYNGTAWEAFAPSPSTSAPQMDGTAAPGTSAAYARGDHVHPTDTSRVPTSRKVNGKALSSDVTLTGADIAVSGTDATKISAALAGKASKSDATLANASDWVCSPAKIGVAPVHIVQDQSGAWYPTDGDGSTGAVKGDAQSLSLSWAADEWYGGVALTATRAALGGYVLGSQTDKPLASEAEAEALRAGKQNALTAQQLANIAAVSDALAFDATHSYAAGDPVVYNGTLYTFTAAHTGAWTGSDVSAVDIIARLAGKLDKSGDTMTGSLTIVRSGDSIKIDGSTIRFNDVDGDPTGGTISGTDGGGNVTLPTYSGTLALAAANPTAGNLAALDANGNPTDSGVKASDKLDSTSAAPAFSTSSTYAVGEHVTYNGGLYRCTTAVTTAGAWDASKWTADTASNYFQYALTTKTIDNGAVTLDDRAMNAVAVSSALASLTINFPTATSGRVRDFGLRLSVASGITTAPELALPQGVVCENADGTAPEIGADGAATILYFTETASGVFLVKGEVVTAIS